MPGSWEIFDTVFLLDGWGRMARSPRGGADGGQDRPFRIIFSPELNPSDYRWTGECRNCSCSICVANNVAFLLQ